MTRIIEFTLAGDRDGPTDRACVLREVSCAFGPSGLQMHTYIDSFRARMWTTDPLKVAKGFSTKGAAMVAAMKAIKGVE